MQEENNKKNDMFYVFKHLWKAISILKYDVVETFLLAHIGNVDEYRNESKFQTKKIYALRNV